MAHPLLRPTPSPTPSPLSSPRASRSQEAQPIEASPPLQIHTRRGSRVWRSSVLDGGVVPPTPPSLSPRFNKERGPLRHRDIARIFKRFCRLASPYWILSEGKLVPWIFLTTICAIYILTTWISMMRAFYFGYLFDAVIAHDAGKFWKSMGIIFVSYVISTSVITVQDYMKKLLSLRWRKWMTTYFLERYFTNKMFYKIQSHFMIDNPDQRIINDIPSFTSETLDTGFAMFKSLSDLVQFGLVLVHIMPFLYFVILGYALCGTVITVAIGKALGMVGLNFMSEKRDADFRYQLVRIRENAESIAFYHGARQERRLLSLCFQRVYDIYRKLLIAERNLSVFTESYGSIITILPYVCIGPLVVQGKANFGLTSQVSLGFNRILGAFSFFVYSYQGLTATGAVIERLGQFIDILDGIHHVHDSQTDDSKTITVLYLANRVDYPNGSAPVDEGQLLLEIQNLTLQIPEKGDIIIGDLSFYVTTEDRLLIVGPSGSGKTSLLRALAGLWNFGCGNIIFYLKGSEMSGLGPSSAPQSEENARMKSKMRRRVFFLPQKPYMVLGTLRQQLLYPTWTVDPPLDADDSPTDDVCVPPKPEVDDLIKVLDAVNLRDILARCGGLDSVQDWSSVLSVGEQQRLAFARLLLSKPKLVLLDESTSALDETNEARMYQLIEYAGISYMSVAHRASLRAFHNKVLRLSKLNSTQNLHNWRFESILEGE